MNNLPKNWGKGSLPEGWGSKRSSPLSPVFQREAEIPADAPIAAGQEDTKEKLPVDVLGDFSQSPVENSQRMEEDSTDTGKEGDESYTVANSPEQEVPITGQKPTGYVGRDDGRTRPRHGASRFHHHQQASQRYSNQQTDLDDKPRYTATPKKKKILPGMIVTLAVAVFIAAGLLFVINLQGKIPVRETSSSALPSSVSTVDSTSQTETSLLPGESQNSASDKGEVPVSSKPDTEPSSEPNSATSSSDTLESQTAPSSGQTVDPTPVYCSVCGADCTYSGLIDGMCEDCYEIYGQPYNEPNVYCPNCNYGFTVSGVGISGFECPQCHYKFYDPEDSYSQDFYDIAGYYEGYQILMNGEPHNIDSSDAQLTLYADGSAYLYYAGVDFHLSWDVGEMWDESAPSEIIYFDAVSGNLTMYLPQATEVLFSRVY